MDIQTAYQFLKPHLKNYSQKERKALARLIEGEPVKPVRKKKFDPIKSDSQFRRYLLRTVFKN